MNAMSNQKPLVSIVIPTYNYGEYLRQALNSALAQTYQPIEIWVIDDGSTDDTRQIVEHYGARVNYVYQENHGQCHARNSARKLFRGDYFLNLDADNYLDATFVEKTMGCLLQQEDPRVAFAYTQRMLVGDATGRSDFPAYDIEKLKTYNYIDSCSLLRGDVVREIEFDAAFSGGLADYDFYLTLAERGYRGILVDEPLFYYRTHQGSITHANRLAYRRLQITRRLLKKHRTFFNLSEKRRMLRRARERVRMQVIAARKDHKSWVRRWHEMFIFMKLRPPLVELVEQLRYTVCPKY